MIFLTESELRKDLEAAARIMENGGKADLAARTRAAKTLNGKNALFQRYVELTHELDAPKMSEQALAYRTGFDRPGDPHARLAYQRGLNIGQQYDEFHIARNSVWSASRENSNCFSYEKLGYHRATAEFFQGILDSDIKVIDHRPQ